jgi:membrane fusion protein, heavy metal efflux system
MRRPSSGPGSLSVNAATIVLGTACLTLGAVVANVSHDRIFHSEAREAPAEPQAEAAPPKATVTLPEGKIKAAGIRTEPAREEALAAEVAVAGAIEPNPNRRVDIRPRATGVVRSVRVQPSQRVKAGEVLALLESADVGTARLNVRARQLDLSIARVEARWRSEIAANVEELIPLLRKGTPASDLEKQFASKPLGAQRAELLSAYADWEIASHEESKQKQLFKEQIVGEHLPFVAMHTRESAQAKFEAALEQVRFDAAQQKRLADQQVRRAEAGVIDAVKRLQILGVQDGPADPLAAAEPSARSAAAEDVTTYPLYAPFDGTILTMSAVPSQRAEPTDVLFTLADLTTVRVVANIPERDLGLLPDLKDGSVKVTAAAYPGRTFDARMLYTAPMVDPATRRVRLVAEAPNPDGLLRLGMFVQVQLDQPTAGTSLTVPVAAVAEVEGRPAVFVAAPDGRTFSLRPVTTGRAAAGRQAITAGLKPGEPVVAAGAFTLKSELVLQNEPAEED